MSNKRKSTNGGRGRPKKKNGNDDIDENLSDFEEEYKSDASNGSNDLNDELGSEELPDDGMRVQGPQAKGRFLLCGAVNWELYNRKTAVKGCKNTTAKNLFVPTRFSPLDTLKVRVVASGCTAAHSIIITEDFKVYTLGRNEKGQLGTGDTETRYQPYLLESMSAHNVVNAACGRNHTLLLTDRGTVYTMGDNKMGQCGIGSNTQMMLAPSRIRYKGPPIVKINCGGDFSMVLDLKGALHAFGDPEYGQLGNNTNGEYFVSSTKLVRNCVKAPRLITTYIEKRSRDHIIPLDVTEIIDFDCGTNHTVAIDSKKRVFSWGFGGYGRLGHAEPKDEMVPRQIKYFETQGKGVKGVYCGSQFSIVISEFKMTYLFGKVKNTGEVNMYPKPLPDLQGWQVRSMGCGTSSVVLAADNSVISFGAAPCFGELGHGEMRKSTTIPMEVKALEGIYIEQIAMGQAHTLMIAREDNEQDTERINDIPIFNP